MYNPPPDTKIEIEVKDGEIKVTKDGEDQKPQALVLAYTRGDGLRVTITSTPSSVAVTTLVALFLMAPWLLHGLMDFFMDMTRLEAERQKGTGQDYGFYFNPHSLWPKKDYLGELDWDGKKRELDWEPKKYLVDFHAGS